MEDVKELGIKEKIEKGYDEWIRIFDPKHHKKVLSLTKGAVEKSVKHWEEICNVQKPANELNNMSLIPSDKNCGLCLLSESNWLVNFLLNEENSPCTLSCYDCLLCYIDDCDGEDSLWRKSVRDLYGGIMAWDSHKRLWICMPGENCRNMLGLLNAICVKVDKELNLL